MNLRVPGIVSGDKALLRTRRDTAWSPGGTALGSVADGSGHLLVGRNGAVSAIRVTVSSESRKGREEGDGKGSEELHV